MELRKLNGAGVEVLGVTAADIAKSLEHDEEKKAVGSTLATALKEYGLVLMQNDGVALSPGQLRTLYTRIHEARFPAIVLQDDDDEQKTTDVEKAKDDKEKETMTQVTQDEEENIRGRTFPGFSETSILGFASHVELHGLRGKLHPRSWWERNAGEWHHDGAFSARSPVVPALVSMSCFEAPTPEEEVDGSIVPAELMWNEKEKLTLPPGSTLFYSTRKALELAKPEDVARARKMVCVYKGGFDRVRVGQYPKMSNTWLTALEPPKGPKEEVDHKSITEMPLKNKKHWLAAVDQKATSAAMHRSEQEEKDGVFRHRLVQTHDDGSEYIVITWTCLDEIEEEIDDDDGDEKNEELHDTNGGRSPPPPKSRRTLAYDDARSFIESVLGAGAKSPWIQVVNWRPGNYVIFDNLSMQHSVSPTDVYAHASSTHRRVMTRTAMQPTTRLLV